MKDLFKSLCLAVSLFCMFGCSGGTDETLQLNSEDDLNGLTVSCTSGSYYEHKYSAIEEVNMFAAKSESDALQAMRQGLADVFVSDEVMLTNEAMKRLNVKKALRGTDCFDAAFAVKKGNIELANRFNEFLQTAPVQDYISHWIEGTPELPEIEPVAPGAAPLRCVTAVNLEPVCFVGEGGQWMGMDAEILRRFAASMGRPFEMLTQDLGSAILALQSGEADMVSGCLFITEERKKSVDFTMPYYRCHPAFFVLDKSNSTRPGLGERFKMNLITESRWQLITKGLWETVKITLFSILIGTLLGIGVCAAKRSRRKWLRSIISVYQAFIQGTPTLVLLLIMFYVIFAGSGVSASAVAVATFAFCFASTSGSIFSTAISTVPKGQTEAGLSLGFTPFKTFTGIVFPQALKKGLPLYTGECVSLLKSTSIVGYIAIQDLTKASDIIRSRTFDAFVPLLVVTILYFVLAWLIRSLLSLLLKTK